MKTLDAYTIPLQSINLIEASAGTGKSWTVTYLYIRLILEKNLTVDQILVVTFTDAATKELSDAIRQRIVDALNAFETEVTEGAYTKDDEYRKLINQHSDHQEAIRRLNRAKLSMDESAVFTIHSFCQRCLKENAFEAALPFESELLADDSEIMQKLSDDFWRRTTQNAPKSLLFKLQQKSITPDSLLKDVKQAVGKPYLKLCGPDSKQIKSEKWSDLEQRLQQIIKQWTINEADVSSILLNDKNLNGNKFRSNTIKNLCSQMNKISALYDINADFIKSAEKFKQSYIEAGVKAKCTAPEHSFFSAWEMFSNLWEELNRDSDDFLNNTRIALIDYLQTELPKEKLRLGVLSFDDLLLQLQHTLNTKPELAAKLRLQYQAALIDEFQDTDPIQYDIFQTIYDDATTTSNAVFFVGDPKQAIYSFRGGDIHTYLKAKSNTLAENQYTLDKNWRSHKDLIEAFNTFYALADNPFKDEEINYVEVASGDRTTDVLSSSQTRSAFNLWHYTFDDDKAPVGTIRKDIADAISGDIAQTLNDALLGKATIGDRAISGGDIAILVRSHTHADTIKSALNARGIPSVQNSRNSIYQTHEADELIYLLKAIVNPQQEDELRRALVTEFMGCKSDDLIRFLDDSDAWEERLITMQNLHQQWKKQGFLPMMRSLMKSENVHQRLLSFADGERRISNVLQLSELIHQSARNNMLGMVETLRWLQKQQFNANLNETELRLESDEDLVKIVTIHKSKGLEYPIVYCPYIGMSGKVNSDKIFTFNDADKACLEIGSSAADEHKLQQLEEEKAEDTRLLYVALTRAKYQCNVVCFDQPIFRNPDKTALGWLLSNGETVAENKDQFYANYQQNLQGLASNTASISVESLPVYAADLRLQTSNDEQQLSAREFKASIKQQAQITSFSGLTAGAHDEAPDYDAMANHRSQQAQSIAIASDKEFPRGATAGTAIHEIFEHIDFLQPVSEQLDIVKASLDKYAFDEKHQNAVIPLIQDTLNARLYTANNEFCLAEIAKDQRLDEMEFYLPLARLRIDDLKQILFQHLPHDNPHWQTIRDAVNELYFDEVEGFLKGFIDLIFEYDGHYYLADYKSNSLPDYGEEALYEAMAHSHYYLQYLFYSVALHRYLKQRVEGYQWDKHIGGAYYLFIRGMGGKDENATSANNADIIEMSVSENETASSLSRGVTETTLEHSDDDPKGEMKSSKKGGGVFFDKPSLALIEALDNLFISMELAS